MALQVPSRYIPALELVRNLTDAASKEFLHALESAHITSSAKAMADGIASNVPSIPKEELEKCKNKVESTLIFTEMDVLNKATNLAISELLGDANLINEEPEKYQKVTAEKIKTVANKILQKENCSTLYYLKK